MSRRPPQRHGKDRVYYELSYADVQAIIAMVGPAVDEALEPVAKKVANAAKRKTNVSDKEVDHKRRLDFWPDEWFPHKHMRPSEDVKKSKYERGGWIVRANRPYGHLVEYGHYLVTPSGHTIGFVPPHPFLRPARDEVAAGLGRMEL